MIQQPFINSHATHGIRFCLALSTVLMLAACGSGSSSDTATNSTTGPTGPTNDDDAETSDTGSSPSDTGIDTRNTAIGEVLVFGEDDLTLYTFANDVTGQSNCDDGCAIDWPPIIATEETELGDFSTIERSDRSLQWAFKGKPLYHYAGDGATGEANGEGLGGVWYVARPDPVTTGSTSLGNVLVGKGSTNAGFDDATQRADFDKRTLYVFANDTAGVSNCSAGCATNWPPLYADRGAEGSNDYSIIVRENGTVQWAYRSQPLYFYAGDSAPGDTLGEGVGGVWAVAQP